jgi:hypothetical protein
VTVKPPYVIPRGMLPLPQSIAVRTSSLRLET